MEKLNELDNYANCDELNELHKFLDSSHNEIKKTIQHSIEQYFYNSTDPEILRIYNWCRK